MAMIKLQRGVEHKDLTYNRMSAWVAQSDSCLVDDFESHHLSDEELSDGMASWLAQGTKMDLKMTLIPKWRLSH